MSMFDREKVLERTGGEELLARLVDRLTVLLPQQLDAVETAIAAEDARTLERTAHSIKGALGNFEAPDPVGVARQLEACGAEGRCADASALLPELRRLTTLLLVELREFAGLPPAGE